MTIDLNDQQRLAVASDASRIMCIAPAGSGKTAVLAARAARLLVESGVPSQHMLLVTFTRRAAAEMALRVEHMAEQYAKQLGKPPLQSGPTVGTLHSWCATMLRSCCETFGRDRNFTIYDDRDRTDLIRSVAADLGHPKAETGRIETLWGREEIRREYCRRLEAANALDYDGIESAAIKALDRASVAARWVGRYRHLLVDEFQDVSREQHDLIEKLRPRNLFVVLDPRQSLYSWRGADPGLASEMVESGTFEVVELTINYRSHHKIVSAANRLVDGPWKDMETLIDPKGTAITPEHISRLGKSSILSVHEGYDESSMVAGLVQAQHTEGLREWRDIVVLGRNWRGLNEIRQALAKNNIPHRYCGDESDPWETDDGRQIARLLLLAHNYSDDNLAAALAGYGALGRQRFEQAPLRMRAAATRNRRTLFSQLCSASAEWAAVWMNWGGFDPEGRIGLDVWANSALDALGVFSAYTDRQLTSRLADIRTVLDLLGNWTDNEGGLYGFSDWWGGRSSSDRISDADEVTITTVHGFKGGEIPCVLLTGCVRGQFPTSRKSASDEDRAEDLRVFYVGVTRARERLILTYGTQPQRFGGVPDPSPFLHRAKFPAAEPWKTENWGSDGDGWL